MPGKGSTAESGPQLTLASGVLLPVSIPVDVKLTHAKGGDSG